MSSNLPPVSIGIPFFNAETFLLDSIRSVFAQTHQDWELILMDDGSSDRSLDVARSIDDPRVRVYSDGVNKKLASRLNEINDLARFDYVARMDADDLMAPDRISTLLRLLEDNREYDLASCGTYSVDAALNLLGQRGQRIEKFTLEGLLDKSQRFVHAGLVARKAWYERNRYDERLVVSQDGELWRRAAKAGDFNAISIADPLYIYREESNVTARKLLTAYKMERLYMLAPIDGRVHRLRRWLKSWGRSLVVVGLDAVGGMEYLLERRQGGKPCQATFAEYESVVASVLRARVPQARFS